MRRNPDNLNNIKYLLSLILSLVIFTGCNSRHDSAEKTSQPLKQASKHAASGDRLKIIMENLYTSARESETSGQVQKISENEMANMIEAVEELLFNAEMMTSGIPESSLDEKELITFRVLAGQLYTETLNIQQLANNYDYRLIEPAYQQLNQTCTTRHSLYSKQVKQSILFN
jgi:hypothetical protein